MPERVLVATDGSDGSLGALRIAAELQERMGAEVEVVSIWEPTAFEMGLGLYSNETPLFDESPAKAHREQVVAQLKSLGRGAENWPLSWAVGGVIRGLAARCEQKNYDRIILGAGRTSRPMQRISGGEVPLHLIPRLQIPLLAVRAEENRLPAKAFAAVDFSVLSLRALQSLLGVLQEGGSIVLAHARGALSTSQPANLDWLQTYDRGAEVRLEDLASCLRGVRSDVRVRTRVLEVPISEEPADVLLKAAHQERADLLVAGSHGLGFWGRIWAGSISTQFLRKSNLSVLIAPPHSAGGGEEAHPREMEGPMLVAI